MSIEVTRRQFATLPNCDRCGRFTSKPVVDSGCDSYGAGVFACWERLLCQRCAEVETAEGAAR